ncbi:MAG: prolipoprotein diacylglyceryl transferase family protein [Gemmataceae bacterium]
MHQILFTIRLSSIWEALPDLPIYGYGTMLFVAFLACLWLAKRLSRREGIPEGTFADIAVWLFLAGIFGARLTFYIQYQSQFQTIGQFFAIWDGGLVFYGSFFGGLIGYLFIWRFYLRKRHISNWKMLDVLAPCLALGLAIGRLGCLMNGCCYGNVACSDCPAIHFPLASAPRFDMTERGYQTAAGFTADPRTATVEDVDPHSALAGVLKKGDRIVSVDLKEPYKVDGYDTLNLAFSQSLWPRGQNTLQMTVLRDGKEVAVEPVVPRGIGLHPTQIYETISMALLTFMLLSYYPFKRRDGMVLVLWMACYAMHRFLNEMLRTDTKPVAFGMTLSENISLLIGAAAIVLFVIIRLKGEDPEPPPAPSMAPSTV